MAWHQSGAKPLPEPMITQLRHAFVSPHLNVLKHVLKYMLSIDAFITAFWVTRYIN